MQFAHGWGTPGVCGGTGRMRGFFAALRMTTGGGGQSVGAKPHLKSEMGAQLLGFAGWPLSSWTGAKGQGGFGSLLDLGAGYGVG